MMNLQLPIWCVSHRKWCVSDILRSDTTSLVWVPTGRGESAVPLFSTLESVERFTEVEPDGTARFAVCSLENIDALRQFLKYLKRVGVANVVVDPGSGGLLFKVAQLIEELPSDECESQSTVYRSDYFLEWDKRNGS